MPWGTNVATNRGFGVAAVCARTVAAGTIASSSGNASVTPVPRRKVRREMCFFEMNMVSLCRSLTSGGLLRGFRGPDVVLKWRALDDAEHESREAIVAA